MTQVSACRYISEVHDGFKLHPIDFIDVGTGATIRYELLTGGQMSSYGWR